MVNTFNLSLLKSRLDILSNCWYQEINPIICLYRQLNYWVKFEQEDDITLQQFIDKWSGVLGTEINMIFCGSKIIFSDFTSSDKSQNLSTILKGLELNPFDSTEEFIISSDDYEDLPSINITLRKNESMTLNV